MQKVFKSCYPLDKRCYEVFELTEDILMEHAARGMAEYIRNKFDKRLFCIDRSRGRQQWSRWDCPCPSACMVTMM